MKETVDVHDGNGTIHLTGSPSDTIVYWKKEPRMVCFFAEMGTVWRYHVGREIDEELLRENYEYESLVKEGCLDVQKPLSEQFHHLTKLPTNGRYRLHLGEFPWQFGVLPAIARQRARQYYHTYGGTVDLIATQTYLNVQVVESYKKAIMDGVKPIVVLYKIEESWAISVLDGHHKLQAYKERKQNPQALVISKLDFKETGTEQAVQLVKKLGLDDAKCIQAYREEKRTKAYLQNFHRNYSEGLQTYFQ